MVLSVFERKWQSLPRFQRTWGALRLLALWVARNHQDEHRKATREPLIALGLAPLQDPTFRAALFEQLGDDGLEIPVTTDIIGKSDAHAVRLDKEATDEGQRNQLARNLRNSQRDLDETIFRAYRHVYLLGKDNRLVLTEAVARS